MSPTSRPRTVLVTGAAKRLGRSIALALAAGGWQVAVHYRASAQDAIDTVAACADLAGASAHFDADFEDEAAVRGLVPRVIAHFGQLDAVVNSASLFEHDDVQTFGFAALEKHLRSNTATPVLLAQALHRHVAERVAAGEADARGAVVNLLDRKLWNQNPDFMSYTLSKAALEAAGTMLALALAPRVRVVGVAPGLTLTSHMLSDEKFAQLHALSPLGRSSTPEDVAATVKFALENQYINGNPLLVAGGLGLPDGWDKGQLVKPTVLAGGTNQMTVAGEEIVGPVLVIIGYDTLDEAVQIANDTPYGLAAYVSGTDTATLHSVANRLRAGQVILNNAGTDMMAPFGGFKESGSGRGNGQAAIMEYLEPKSGFIRAKPAIANPFALH